MKSQRMHRLILIPATLLAGLAVTGCAVSPSAAPVAVQGSAITGRAMGGQQPVSGATVQLYATNSTGYGLASTALITSVSAAAGHVTYPITTDAGGNFSISNAFTCPTPASTPVYITITGGNPGNTGGVVNNNLALMAALGPCSGLSSILFVNVSELSTVASVWALSPFMTDIVHIGTSSTNALGLTNAFAAVNKLYNIGTGAVGGPALPSGATFSSDEFNALGDILSSCVNSTGGTAGNGSNCGNLFADATPTGGTAPTDTVTAAMNIAQNPASNVAALFGLVAASGATFTTAETLPTSWTIAINYTGGGLSGPKGIAADASGNIWLPNNTGNSVTELSNTGAAISTSSGYTGGSLSGPWAIALDAAGSPWVTNNTGSSLTHFSSTGTSPANYTGNGLNKPKGVAVDSVGNIWVANSNTNYVSAFTSTGTAISYYTGSGITTPIGLAVNPQ